MKKSKIPKSNDPVKILRMISREDEFERNGGGQWVAKNRIWKDKTKYDRKKQKKSLRDISNSFSFYLLVRLKQIIFNAINLKSITFSFCCCMSSTNQISQLSLPYIIFSCLFS